MPQTIQEIKKYITQELSLLYPKKEAEGMALLMLKDILKTNMPRLVANYNMPVPAEKKLTIENALTGLKKHQPIQYVLGKVSFYGLELKVSRATFIPRPETEELVGLIIKENNCKAPSILDIGTGSGCIAIALKKQLPSAYLTAIDCDKNALAIAKYNAKKYHTNILFRQMDFLQPRQWSELPPMDIIVSNPPYILESDFKDIPLLVRAYEPHKALFVKDKNALVFYEHIANFALQKLQTKGKIYVEINEKKADEVSSLFAKKGFIHIKKYKDFRQNSRIVYCEKP